MGMLGLCCRAMMLNFAMILGQTTSGQGTERCGISKLLCVCVCVLYAVKIQIPER